MAHTAFLLEPSLNPGLEAQAAARICRLGAWAGRAAYQAGRSHRGRGVHARALQHARCELFVSAVAHASGCMRPLPCHPPAWLASAPPAAPLPCAGQTKPTRVVRLLAEDSVERQVLEVSARPSLFECLLLPLSPLLDFLLSRGSAMH